MLSIDKNQEQLHVLALGKDEILLEGSVQNLAFAYEK